jgi:uncharacterized protein with GYD domain
MARRGKRKVYRTQKEEEKVAYFYLIEHTEKGVKQSAKAKEQGQNDVARAVKEAGGMCSLYLTRGAPFDYVSVMTGLSPSAAIKIVGAIESRGTVKARLIVGTHLKGAVSV